MAKHAGRAIKCDRYKIYYWAIYPKSKTAQNAIAHDLRIVGRNAFRIGKLPHRKFPRQEGGFLTQLGNFPMLGYVGMCWGCWEFWLRFQWALGAIPMLGYVGICWECWDILYRLLLAPGAFPMFGYVGMCWECWNFGFTSSGH